jgi:hypothetical protein
MLSKILNDSEYEETLNTSKDKINILIIRFIREFLYKMYKSYSYNFTKVRENI